MRNQIKSDYFEWLFDLVCGDRYSNEISYRKLLTQLHKTRFKHVIRRDKNRASDGIKMRRRFALTHDEDSYDLIVNALAGPCSMLEMMAALALRCEEDYMDDPCVGDRVTQWFWNMVASLGLGSMIDEHYDPKRVDDVLTRFMNREYEPNGRGGLFTIRNCEYDLRSVEIWCQLCWYLDSIT